MKSFAIVAVLLFAGPLSLGQCASRLPAATSLADPLAQRYVLALARRAFDTYVRTRDVIDPPSPLPLFLQERSGVFVSTMRHGAPRTCMGTLYPIQPDLAEEVIQNAVASAGRDRRFPPVRPAELASLVLIVSVVDEPHPISAAQATTLDPATDGLAVKYQDRYGVVLSGETFDAATMVAWGRTRARAPKNAPAEYFELHDVRFMESQFK